MLGKEPSTQVEVIDGNSGEFTVTVDGREVASKGESLPEPATILAAVRDEQHAGADQCTDIQRSPTLDIETMGVRFRHGFRAMMPLFGVRASQELPDWSY